ncbi:MAG: LTA synthase family protein [Coprococcus sp.]
MKLFKQFNQKKYGILWRAVFFCCSFIYLELLFHLAIYNKIDRNIIHPVLFAICSGLTISVITSLFKKPINAITGYLLLSIISVYYIAQFVYYKIFRTFLSLVSIAGADDAMNFKSVMFSAIKDNIIWILAFLVPVIILIIINSFFVSFARPSRKQELIALASTVCSFVLAILILPVSGKDTYSPYNLFHGRYILELSMNRLGVMVTTIRDGITMLSGDSTSKSFALNDNVPAAGQSVSYDDDETATGQTPASHDNDEAATEEIPVYVPQTDDRIDFTELYSSTDDEELKNLSAYFSSAEPTYTNEYTGMFEGYNVIFVTAESLSRYGINKECTPTLYKIYNEGFVFENFYNPLWYHSTIDGEYTTCLSQYPCSFEWSFEKSGNTYQPYALGNALNKLGYNSYAYHDFDATYYDRTTTHPNMGYTTFKAIDYGLDIPFYNMYSDLDAMEAVYKDFINDDKFNMYFMSFSGHLPYDYDSQYMCLKNREEAERLTEGMDLSDEATAYIAAQMELDKALEFLINKLDEAGKLENTVFIVAPDHYPYGLTDGVYNELAGKDIENDPFELHRNGFGIWSASMEQPVKVNKLCSSVDILPTVLNLMGVDYDSRLLAGHDILSDSEELVIFANQSFITDKIRYNAATDEVSYMVPQSNIPDGYLESLIEEVENKLYISNLLIDKDYFAYIYRNN